MRNFNLKKKLFQKVETIVLFFENILYRVLFSHKALSENILNLNYYLIKSDSDEI